MANLKQFGFQKTCYNGSFFIFILKKDGPITPLRNWLDRNAMWGGCTKDTGVAWGWEFQMENQHKVLSFLVLECDFEQGKIEDFWE